MCAGANRGIKVEICCGSADDAVAAASGGADRVELNSAVLAGGLTPSAGAIEDARRRVDIGLMVMIRPRAGGFCYSDAEFEVMRRDVEIAVEFGADGIVFGILKADGRVDAERCGEIIRRARGREVVFHRAFDVACDAFAALDILIELGITRVLTSGQQPTAIEGAEMIGKLIEYADGRIEILPGAGIRGGNVRQFVERTGATQVHMSAFSKQVDSSTQHNASINFGAPGASEGEYDQIDSGKVRAICEALGKDI